MKHSNKLFLAITYAWITLHGQTSVAANDYGTVNLGICRLDVPETKAMFDFSESSQHCENNKSGSFTLEGVNSATLIQFYGSEECSDAHLAGNFYVKLKTTKQPTDWGGHWLDYDALKGRPVGHLVPGKNIRVEAMWDGTPGDSWNEKISCVYIERSQPVN